MDELEDKPTKEEVMAFLEGIVYPATKQELVEWALQQGADDTVEGALDKIPDQTYETQADLTDALADLDLESEAVPQPTFGQEEPK